MRVAQLFARERLFVFRAERRVSLSHRPPSVLSPSPSTQPPRTTLHPGQDDATTPSNGQVRRSNSGRSVTGRSGSSASRRAQRRNTSPVPANPGTAVPRSMKATHSTPDVMGSPQRRQVAKAVSTAQKRVRQRSVQFHGRRMGLEIGCRVDILNKSRRPIPNLVS